MIKPVLLWSDALIFLLVTSLFLFAWQLRQNPQARKRWHSVFTSKVGLSSFMVIVFYVLIALLDSIHFREALPPAAINANSIDNISNRNGEQNTVSEVVAYDNEVKSVLDVILSDIEKNHEKTYSAPFAIYSFAKENSQDEFGNVVREYPRLKSAGQHVNNADEVLADVITRSAQAIVKALILTVIVIGIHWWINRRREKVHGPSAIPWTTAYWTFALLSIISFWMLELGSVYHIFGTDKVGHDVLVNSLKAVRTGVLIGTLATLLTLPIAIILGISAGYFKGWVDDVVQYIYTTLSSIPGILLIAASVLLIDVYIETHSEEFDLTILRADFKFLALCAILGLTSWTGLCRLLRAETLKISQLDYVQAAHAFGVSHPRVIGKHILPNVTHIILIALVLDFSGFVLAEAVLSYIGVGVDASMGSWGNMINAARSELSRDPAVWWSVSAAFAFMFSLVLAANLFSDQVRNAFDPRLANNTEKAGHNDESDSSSATTLGAN